MSAARNLPNLITLLRLACVPAAVGFILQGQLASAFWTFVLAGASDAADGILARLLRAQSALGSYLDALADKVLLVGIYLSLGAIGLVAGWLVVLVVGRDLLMVAAAIHLHLRHRQRRVMPLLISKINTAAQIGLAGLILGQRGLGLFAGWPPRPLAWLVAVTTVGSGLAYLLSWTRLRQEGRESGGT